VKVRPWDSDGGEGVVVVAGWRASCYSTAVGGTACVQVVMATEMPNGEIRTGSPQASGDILRPAPASPAGTTTRTASPPGPGIHGPEWRGGSVLGAPRERLRERLRGMRFPKFSATATDCMERLEIFRDASYGSPVVRDDSVLDIRRDQDALAAATGGDWNPVEHTLAPVVRRIRALGSGAAAFVLVSRPGKPLHGFVVVNEGGEVFRVETQAPAGPEIRHTSEVWPLSSGARVIVVDPSGRAVALTHGPSDEAFATAADTVNATLDPSSGLSYEGGGMEWETYFILGRSDRKKIDLAGEVIFKDAKTGITVVTECYGLPMAGGRYFSTGSEAASAGLGRATIEEVNILEIVIPVMYMVSGDNGRPNAASVIAQARDILDRLKKARSLSGVIGPDQPGTPLKDLFPRDERWQFVSWGEHATVMPGPKNLDNMAVQFSVGVPVAGLDYFLKFARHRTWVDGAEGLPRVKEHQEESFEFARDVAARFISRLIGRPADEHLVTALEAIPSVVKLRGAAAIAYQQFAAVVHAVYDRRYIAKNFTSVIMRTYLSGLRQALPADVRHFLADDADWIKGAIEDHVSRTIGDLRTLHSRIYGRSFPGLMTVIFGKFAPRVRTFGDYVDNFLLPMAGGELITPFELFEAADFETLDFNDGRLGIGLAVLELRHHGASVMNLREISGYYDEIEQVAGKAFERASEIERHETTAAGKTRTRVLIDAARHLANRGQGQGLLSKVQALFATAAAVEPQIVRKQVSREDLFGSVAAELALALYDYSCGMPSAGRKLRVLLEGMLADVTDRRVRFPGRGLDDGWLKDARKVIDALPPARPAIAATVNSPGHPDPRRHATSAPAEAGRSREPGRPQGHTDESGIPWYTPTYSAFHGDMPLPPDQQKCVSVAVITAGTLSAGARR
jgi:hypothetical protein